MSRKNKSQAGFTLVELMVVAIIVAILAAVAIPLMSGNKRRAAATEAQAAISTLWTAERLYYTEKGYYLAASGSYLTVLPGIESDNLNGTFFDQNDYSVAIIGKTLIIRGNHRQPAKSHGIVGDVQLVINTDTGVTQWSGSLLR